MVNCPLCTAYEFSSPEILLHELISMSVRNIACPLCSDVLRGIDKFTIHLCGHILISNNNHDDDNNNGLQKINYFQQELSEKDITVGINRLQSDNIDNNDELLFNEDLCSHKIIYAVPHKNHVCKACEATFEDENLLLIHTELNHNNNSKFGTELLQPTKLSHTCQKTFKMKEHLTTHLRVSHSDGAGYSISNLENDINDIELMDTVPIQQDAMQNEIHLIGNLKLHELKQWSCNECGKQFTTKYFLKKHKRLHTGEMPYTCSICQKSFTFQQSYHKHMLYHSDDKPHSCSQCGRSFRELSTLHNHQLIHTGEKPFSCNICGKRFRQRVSCLVHNRIHSGLKPYKCTGCNKMFRYKASERSHKCKAIPSGQVIRHGSSFIEKLMLKTQLLSQHEGNNQIEIINIQAVEDEEIVNKPTSSNFNEFFNMLLSNDTSEQCNSIVQDPAKR